MEPSPEVTAATALTVYLVGLTVTFGARTWQQYRRTGDTGIRRIASDEGCGANSQAPHP